MPWTAVIHHLHWVHLLLPPFLLSVLHSSRVPMVLFSDLLVLSQSNSSPTRDEQCRHGEEWLLKRIMKKGMIDVEYQEMSCVREVRGCNKNKIICWYLPAHPFGSPPASPAPECFFLNKYYLYVSRITFKLTYAFPSNYRWRLAPIACSPVENSSELSQIHSHLTLYSTPFLSRSFFLKMYEIACKLVISFAISMFEPWRTTR